MDISPENEMYGDIVTDISDFIYNVEQDLCYKSPINNTVDNFKEGFENVFGISIDQIDNVEEIIQNGSDREEKVNIYSEIVEKIKSFFSKSYGITFDNGDGTIIDLNKLYTLYRILYLKSDILFKYIVAGRFIDMYTKHEEQYVDLDKTPTTQFVFNTIGDSNEFTIDNIRKWLFISDPGNEEYEWIFGKYLPTDDDKQDDVEGSLEVYIDDNTFFNKMFTSWYTVLPLSEVNDKISKLRHESALIIEGVINGRRN